MSIFHLCTLSKQRIGFIKKQDPFFIFCPVENSCQIFFCFSNELAYDQRKIYSVHFVACIFSQQCGSKSFSCAWRTKKQAAKTWFYFASQFQFIKHVITQFNPGFYFFNFQHCGFFKNQVIPVLQCGEFLCWKAVRKFGGVFFSAKQ